MPAWVLPAIAGVAAIGGQLLGNKSQSDANQANVELSREQMAWQEAMWNKQNAYNHPVQQMSRYREAGLNPNLIYGSGSASAGNAASVGSYNRATVEPYRGYNLGSAVESYQTMLNYQQEFDNKKASNEYIKTQTSALESRMLNDSFQRAKWAADTAHTNTKRQFAEKTMQMSADAIQANIAKVYQDIESRKVSTQLQELRMEMIRKYEGKISEARISNIQASTARVWQEMQFSKDLQPSRVALSNLVNEIKSAESEAAANGHRLPSGGFDTLLQNIMDFGKRLVGGSKIDTSSYPEDYRKRRGLP